MATGSDPYGQFSFQIKIDGIIVARFSEVSGLTTDTNIIEYREGSDNDETVRELPGLRKYKNIVLKRGWTTDDKHCSEPMIWYVLIIAFFASVWMMAGTAGLGFPGNLIGVVIAIGGSILFASIMFGRQTPARSYGPAPDFRWYWAAVGFEVVAISIAVWWLRRIDRPDYLLPVISGIVGIHFCGLVPAFHSLRFFWIGLVMFLLPIAAVLLLPSQVQGENSPVSRSLVVGVGCALTLWLGALL